MHAQLHDYYEVCLASSLSQPVPRMRVFRLGWQIIEGNRILHLLAACVGGRAGVGGTVCVSWQVARQNACSRVGCIYEPHLKQLLIDIP